MAEFLDLVLPCEPASARRARLALEPFRESLGETRFVDFRLLVSELVAEAIGNVGAPSNEIRLRADRDPMRIRASVEQGAGIFLVSSTRPEPGETGWGVELVQRLSDLWGIRRDDDRATVWFEMFLSR
jgi:hypothetical protein